MEREDKLTDVPPQQIELDIFEELKAALAKVAGPVSDASEALALFDVSAALAETAVSRNWVRPVVDDSKDFTRIEFEIAVIECHDLAIAFGQIAAF